MNNSWNRHVRLFFSFNVVVGYGFQAARGVVEAEPTCAGLLHRGHAGLHRARSVPSDRLWPAGRLVESRRHHVSTYWPQSGCLPLRIHANSLYPDSFTHIQTLIANACFYFCCVQKSTSFQDVNFYLAKLAALNLIKCFYYSSFRLFTISIDSVS